ncbi:MAG: hypothetical protein Ta2B_14900 [Termitinemataceae bacterium]|nr:MAG: hypothetical protein Ta2B_14900 [Termitinemataceae bacterium]
MVFRKALVVGLFFVSAFFVFAQDGSSPGYFDSKGYWHEDTVWQQRQDEQNRNSLNQFQDMLNSAQQHSRDLQRIEAEQAIERQRVQNEQYAQQEQIRIQREQAEAASMRNWSVAVYGTTLWKDSESSGLKDREEHFTVTATDAKKAEAKAIELFKSKWKAYLIDNPNIWANAVMQ